MTGLTQSVSRGMLTTWTTVSSAAQTASCATMAVGKTVCKVITGATQQVIAYTIGRCFRNMFLSKPSYSRLALQEAEDCLNPKAHRDNPLRIRVIEAFDVYNKYYKFQLGDNEYYLKTRVYESRQKETLSQSSKPCGLESEQKHEDELLQKKGDGRSQSIRSPKDTHTCLRVGGKDERSEVSDLRVYSFLENHMQTNGDRDKNLRVLQFSLHEHQIKVKKGYRIKVNKGGQTKVIHREWSTWEPTNSKEISRVFFAFLKHLEDKRNIHVDSLICHSLGSFVLDDLESLQGLPPLLILDRALPSVFKLGLKLYSIGGYPLYGIASLAGWAPAPEDRLIKFFSTSAGTQDLSHRKVVVIEVEEDYYFSGKGAFGPKFTEILRDLGMKVYRNSFTSNEFVYHTRAHHALPLNKLKNKDKDDSTSILPLKPGENVAAGVAKCLMLS